MNTEKELAVTLHNLPGIREGYLGRILQINFRLGRTLLEFLSLPPADMKDVYGLPNPVVRTLKNQRLIAETRERVWERLDRYGIEVVLLHEPDYPQKLKAYLEDALYPVLYLWGDRDLADTKAAALFVSRDPTPEALEVVRKIALKLGEEDYTLVSSPYRRAYRIVAQVAQTKGFPSIVIPDRGITHTIRRLKADPEKTLILSPFGLEDVGTGSSGPKRDQLIAAFADLLIAVQVREDGVIFQELIRAAEKGKQVRVVDWGRVRDKGRSSGNRQLLKLGFPSFPVDLPTPPTREGHGSAF